MTTATSTAIQIPGDEPITLEAGRRNLTELDARLLTAAIQRTSVRLWLLVTQAHDRKAHLALGYGSWEDYARAELKMSPSRSYQLLDTGHVMSAAAKGGADLDELDPPPARVVARVKDRLPEVQRATKAALRDGQDPDKAIRALARQSRPAGERAATASIPAQRARPGRPPTTSETCPVCEGSGQVSKALARRAVAWLRR